MPRSQSTKSSISIKDVAEKANVSIATVSNVLNGKGRIGEKTKKRIFAMCKELGYLPNSAGRNLRRQRTESVGLMFYPTCARLFRNVFYAGMMESLEENLERAGYDLLLSGYETSTHGDEPPRFVRQNKVDGIILLGGFPSKIVSKISQYGLPTLLLDNHQESIQADSVTSDGFAAAQSVVNHLHGLGHKRIVFLGYAHEDFNTDQRIRGFQQAIKDLKLPARQNPVLRNFELNEEAIAPLEKLLARSTPPTAIMAVNDTLASYLINHLNRKRSQVPNKISVFGFDDDDYSRECVPQISTVSVDTAQIGKIGAETILKRIEDREAPITALRLPAQLVHRESVAPAKEG